MTKPKYTPRRVAPNEDPEGVGLHRRPTIGEMNSAQLREVARAHRLGREPRWGVIEMLGMGKH